MTHLVVQVRFLQEFEAWLASYPGDPIVRPASWALDVRYNDERLLRRWLDGVTRNYQADWSGLRYRQARPEWGRPHGDPAAQLFPDGWHEVQVRFTERRAAQLFLLRWK